MDKLVSIIIPNFNRESLIAETLESISSQTYSNFECLVVDDHSTDNSVKVIQEYTEKDSRFKLFKRPEDKPKGANSCRNYGFELSNGDYINWFDSDDLMLETHLSSLIEVIEQKNVDFAVGDSYNFNDEGLVDKPYNFERINDKISPNNFGRQTIGWITDDFLARKEILVNVRFNENFKTDGDEYNFFTQLLHENSNGRFVNQILTHRRLHKLNLINQNFESSEYMFLRKIATIKFLTFKDIEKYKNYNLLKWFLSGYMQYSFKIALQKKWPPFMDLSYQSLKKHVGFMKAISFFASIIFAKYFGKGYLLLRYAYQDNT